MYYNRYLVVPQHPTPRKGKRTKDSRVHWIGLCSAIRLPTILIILQVPVFMLQDNGLPFGVEELSVPGQQYSQLETLWNSLTTWSNAIF